MFPPFTLNRVSRGWEVEQWRRQKDARNIRSPLTTSLGDVTCLTIYWFQRTTSNSTYHIVSRVWKGWDAPLRHRPKYPWKLTEPPKTQGTQIVSRPDDRCKNYGTPKSHIKVCQLVPQINMFWRTTTILHEKRNSADHRYPSLFFTPSLNKRVPIDLLQQNKSGWNDRVIVRWTLEEQKLFVLGSFACKHEHTIHRTLSKHGKNIEHQRWNVRRATRQWHQPRTFGWKVAVSINVNVEYFHPSDSVLAPRENLCLILSRF